MDHESPEEFDGSAGRRHQHRHDSGGVGAGVDSTVHSFEYLADDAAFAKSSEDDDDDDDEKTERMQENEVADRFTSEVLQDHIRQFIAPGAAASAGVSASASAPAPNPAVQTPKPAPSVSDVWGGGVLDKKLVQDIIDSSGGLGQAARKLEYLRKQLNEKVNSKIAEEQTRNQMDPFFGRAEPTQDFCYLCERGRVADSQGKSPEYDYLKRLCDTEVAKKSLFLVATEANNFYMQHQYKVTGKPMTVEMWERHIREHDPNKQEVFHSRIAGLQRVAAKYDAYLDTMQGPPDNKTVKAYVTVSKAIADLIVHRDKHCS